jgi:hypothetical protein
MRRDKIIYLLTVIFIMTLIESEPSIVQLDVDAEGEPDPSVTNASVDQERVPSPSPSAVSAPDTTMSDEDRTEKGELTSTASRADLDSFVWEQIQNRIKDLEKQNETLANDNNRIRQSRKAACNEVSTLRQQYNEIEGQLTIAIRDRDMAAYAHDQSTRRYDATLVEMEELRARMQALESRNRLPNTVSKKRPRVESPTLSVEKRIDYPSNDGHRSGGGVTVTNARNARASTSSSKETSEFQMLSVNNQQNRQLITREAETGARPDKTNEQMPDVLNMDPHATIRYLTSVSANEIRRMGIIRVANGRFEIGTVRFAILARSLVEIDMASRVSCARAMIQVKAYEKFTEGRQSPGIIDLQRRKFAYNASLADLFDHFYKSGVTADELRDAGMGAMTFLKVRVIQDNGGHIPARLRTLVDKEYAENENTQWVEKPFSWKSRRARIATGVFRERTFPSVVIEDVDEDMEQFESFS